MKSIILTFLLFLTSQYASAIVQISESNAVDIVKNIHGENANDYDYYIAVDGNKTYWTVFVDAHPNQLWEHECFTYKVLRSASSLSSVSPMEETLLYMPPSCELKPVSVTHRNKSSHKTPTAFSYNYKKVNNKFSEKIHALIISGGGGKVGRGNEDAFWNDCSFIYKTLTRTYGVPKSNITPLMADGNNPAHDIVEFYPDSSRTQNLDLDEDGIDEIKLSATKSNIISAFDSLYRTIPRNHHLLVFIMAHGYKPKIVPYHSSFFPWCNTREDSISRRLIYDNELADYIRPLTNKGIIVNVAIGSCYSGGFVDALCMDNCVVASASKVNQIARYHDSYEYSEFLLNWTSALNGSSPFIGTVNSDLNNDGIITMEEAFDYAKTNDSFINEKEGLCETPQYASYPKGLGRSLSFSYIPTLGLTIQKANNTQSFWNSNSLWVRHQDDNETMDENIYRNNDKDKLYKCKSL